MPRISKTDKRVRARAAIAGLKQRFGARDIHVVDGKPATRASVIARLQEHLDVLDAVDAAAIALRVAVWKERALDREVRRLIEGLKSLVIMKLGRSRATWHAFGWKLPRKPGPKTRAARAHRAR